ncbi:protein phosphatase inhibitor 2-like isoform X2 [Raphanus sativus]|uniref:Protein phosphatase inhibitor 2 isoform X2 n=1 Tax=Raphanus sativus TaxID=3726 RepID=A0A6J0MWF6_RAPSA|nr:protein phosphatase inhibitor 2 isoform X2 [Raphanus sativus]XP_056860955.1 protein phosphatase inhibitor 2-like isoform X2 [Raphanus sativus]
MTDPKKGRVQWDEANIVEIESNKPVRQKITEPKTPYHPMIHDDDDDVDDGTLSPRGGRSFNECVDDMQRAEELKNALNGESASSSRNDSQGSGSGGGWSSAEDDEADPMDQDGLEGEKNERFSEHRRVHYNEFHKVKELRSLGSFYDDEEEEDEDDDGSKGSEAETTTSPHSKGVNKEVDAAGKSSSSSN